MITALTIAIVAGCFLTALMLIDSLVPRRFRWVAELICFGPVVCVAIATFRGVRELVCDSDDE